jgi:predicted porin
MKKSLITTAVAAGLLGAGAASADPTVYGIIHLSIDTYADSHFTPAGAVIKPGAPNMVSHTSAIGVKGAEDLGDGLKAIYKVEFQFVPDENDSGLGDRDQWVGLKGGWGSVKFGTMSNNYKQMGGKVDPLYRTEAEGRGILNMQSPMHGGQSNNGGRENNTVQYASPKMGGIQLVANTTVSGAGECLSTTPPSTTCKNSETLGVGLRYDSKNIMAYFDYLDPGYVVNSGSASRDNPAEESIMKIGGKFSGEQFSVGLQYEMYEDFFCQGAANCSGGDYIFASGTYSIDKNNVVALTLGQQDKVSQAYAIAYVHNLSKMTNVYAGWGSVEADTCTATSCSYNLGVDENGNVQNGEKTET